jgi:hypothetical protein
MQHRWRDSCILTMALASIIAITLALIASGAQANDLKPPQAPPLRVAKLDVGKPAFAKTICDCGPDCTCWEGGGPCRCGESVKPRQAPELRLARVDEGKPPQAPEAPAAPKADDPENPWRYGTVDGRACYWRYWRGVDGKAPLPKAATAATTSGHWECDGTSCRWVSTGGGASVGYPMGSAGSVPSYSYTPGTTCVGGACAPLGTMGFGYGSCVNGSCGTGGVMFAPSFGFGGFGGGGCASCGGGGRRR